MEQLKKYLGIIWMILGPATISLLILGAVNNIDAAGKADINKPLPWLIVIFIFAPVAVGLSIFGWYAWNGEYEKSTNGDGEKSLLQKNK